MNYLNTCYTIHTSYIITHMRKDLNSQVCVILMLLVTGESDWCLMERKIINYLTTMILSILFPLAWWATIEMHSNSPPNFQIVSGRPLNTHPASV